MLNVKRHTVISDNAQDLKGTHLSRSLAYAGSASLNKFLSTLVQYHRIVRDCRRCLWDLTSISQVLVRVQLPLHHARDEVPSFLHMGSEAAAAK